MLYHEHRILGANLSRCLRGSGCFRIPTPSRRLPAISHNLVPPRNWASIPTLNRPDPSIALLALYGHGRSGARKAECQTGSMDRSYQSELPA